MIATRRVMLIFGLAALVHSAPLAAQKIYWTKDVGAPGSINRANADGTQPETIVSTPVLIHPRAVAVAPEWGYVYWSDSQQFGHLLRADLDGSNIQNFEISGNTIFEIAVDVSAESVYLAHRNGIVRTAPDGTSPQSVISTLLRDPREIALDLEGDRMYWVQLNGKVLRSRLDGTEVEVIVDGGLVDPWGIALDTAAAKVYWSDSGSSPSRVMKSNLDGTQVETLVEQVGTIYGIAIDSANNKLFWANEYAGDIYTSNLDGSNMAVLVSDAGYGLAGVALDSTHSRLYWIEGIDLAIRRCNLDGSQVETVITEGLDFPRSLAIDSNTEKLYWTNISTGGNPLPLINRANLDGSNIESVFDHLDTPRGIALDVKAGVIYWSDSGDYEGADRIGTVRYDGTSAQIVHGISPLSGLAVHPDHEEIYWSELGMIRKTDYQGSQVENVIENWDNRFAGIDLDVINQKLYWADYDGRSIGRSNLDGTNAEVIVQTISNCTPSEVELDVANEKVIWSCLNASRIQRANLDGTNVEDIAINARPFGIAFNPAPHFVLANPIFGAIDARQPHAINDATIRYGWDSIEVQFSGDVSAMGVGQFEVREAGGDGTPPSIASVAMIDEMTLAIAFSGPIEPGARTCVYHTQSGTQACLGYLPGDVNGDGTTSPVDILSLIDSINGVVALPIWSTDIDQSGVTNPADVLRVIDLLNGAGEFVIWNGATLP